PDRRDVLPVFADLRLRRHDHEPRLDGRARARAGADDAEPARPRAARHRSRAAPIPPRLISITRGSPEPSPVSTPKGHAMACPFVLLPAPSAGTRDPIGARFH